MVFGIVAVGKTLESPGGGGRNEELYITSISSYTYTNVAEI